MRLGLFTLLLLAAPWLAVPDALAVPEALAAAPSSTPEPSTPAAASPGDLNQELLASVSAAALSESAASRLEVRFPGQRLSRTLVQWVLAVASHLMERNEHGFYNVRLSGEVRRDQRAVDRFDYRFDIPAPEGDDEPLALVFDRDLRPGSYELALEVEDLSTGRSFRTLDLVEVPSLAGANAAADETAAPAPPHGTAAPETAIAPAAVAAVPEAPAPPRPGIALLRPRDPILIGHQRFAAEVRGAGVERVTFLLDGVPVMTKTRPPFNVELDLGAVPVVRTLAAVAWGGDPETPLARDEMILNTGQERFAVRLVSPADGDRDGGALTGRAALELPADRPLARLEYFVGDERVAVIDAPPFDRAVPLGRFDGAAAVRAVAHLADGRTAEDTVLVGAPGVGDRVDVHLVELFTAVVDGRGRAVDGLSAADFRVSEDGRPQRLARLERVTDLPLHVSLVIDVSGSMGGALEAVSRAAGGFLDAALGPRDRASVVTFDRFPRVAVDFTTDRALVANGMTALRASGGTALHEGLLFALRQFDGIEGQRVVLLFSDGKEGSDRLASEAVLEYARRSGVTVYSIGLDLAADEAGERPLLRRLAHDTGGRAFFVQRAEQVAQVASRIEQDMRSRYLLAYQSSSPAGGGFRVVDVAVARAGAEARTVRGYYP
jgi:Ca-activated chloride channel family protein